MLGVTAKAAGLEGTGGHAGFSSRVNLVVDFNGPSDLDALANHPSHGRHHRARRTVTGHAGEAAKGGQEGRAIGGRAIRGRGRGAWLFQPPTALRAGPQAHGDISGGALPEVGSAAVPALPSARRLTPDPCCQKPAAGNWRWV